MSVVLCVCVEVSGDGEWLFTCCGSAVKALHIDTGVMKHSFEEVVAAMCVYTV